MREPRDAFVAVGPDDDPAEVARTLLGFAGHRADVQWVPEEGGFATTEKVADQYIAEQAEAQPDKPRKRTASKATGRKAKEE